MMSNCKKLRAVSFGLTLLLTLCQLSLPAQVNAASISVYENFNGYVTGTQPVIDGFSFEPAGAGSIAAIPSASDKSLMLERTDSIHSPTLKVSFAPVTDTFVIDTKLLISPDAVKEKPIYLQGKLTDSAALDQIPFLFLSDGKMYLYNGNNWTEVSGASYEYGGWIELMITIDPQQKRFSIKQGGVQKGDFALKEFAGWESSGATIDWTAGVTGFTIGGGDTNNCYTLINELKLYSLSDIQPLAVSETSPGDAAQDVVLTSKVTVSFNNALNPQDFDASKLVVKKDLVVVPPNEYLVSMTNGLKSCVITFKNDLSPDADYDITVSEGITDIYGQAMAQAYSFGFSTAGSGTAVPGISESFDNYPTGAAPAIPGWTLTGGEISVEEIPGEADKSLKLGRTSTNPNVQISFDPLDGEFVLQTKMLLSAGTQKEKAIYLVGKRADNGQNDQIPFLFIMKDGIAIYNGSNWMTVPGTGYEFDQWFQLTVLVNPQTARFSIWKNGAEKGTFNLKGFAGWDNSVAMNWAAGSVGLSCDFGDLAECYTLLNDFKVIPRQYVSNLRLTQSSPADASQGAALDTDMILLFNNELNSATLGGANVTVSRDGEAVPPTDYTISVGDANGSYNRAVISFHHTLDSKTPYTVTLGTGVCDVFGQSLLEDTAITFETVDSSFKLAAPPSVVVKNAASAVVDDLVANGTATATASLANTTTREHKGVMILVLYDEDGALVDITYDSQTVLDGRTEPFTATLDLGPDVTSAYRLGIYFWDELTSMAPLSQKFVYPSH